MIEPISRGLVREQYAEHGDEDDAANEENAGPPDGQCQLAAVDRAAGEFRSRRSPLRPISVASAYPQRYLADLARWLAEELDGAAQAGHRGELPVTGQEGGAELFGERHVTGVVGGHVLSQLPDPVRGGPGK